MSVFDFIQQFILFVIPGVITYLLFCYLTGKKPLTDLLSVAIIFICSTVSFLLGNLLLLLLNLLPFFNFQLADVAQILAGNTKGLTVPNLIAAIVSSILLGVVAVLFWDKNLLFRIANRFKITKRTDNDEVWDNMFDSQPWVILRDYVSNNVYYGCVVKYSDKTTTREMLLVDVNVCSENEGDYHMEQVYISRAPSEFSIEIDKYDKEIENNEES
ncbi:hypothetical protein [Ruminococcus sp.]|uniref:hypothetical protein n=1 Tax=Ruminococcus sp. TaxID=41978 RepID=UPI002E8235FE|nr:hypothetical protein [Ruminococcus sp.]MEE3492044.1 hypothetical protein [Ruminococcus sp.]